MIRKGQVQEVRKGDSLNQAAFIARLFEIAIETLQEERRFARVSFSTFLQHNHILRNVILPYLVAQPLLSVLLHGL